MLLISVSGGCATTKQVNAIKNDISRMNGSIKILSDASVKARAGISRLETSLENSDHKVDGIFKKQEEMEKIIGCEEENGNSISDQIKTLRTEFESSSAKVTGLSNDYTAMKSGISSLEAAKDAHSKNLEEISKQQKTFVTHGYLQEVLEADDKIREATAIQDSLLIHIYYGSRHHELDKEQIDYLIRALNDYDSGFNLKNYTLSNVIGFTSAGETKDIGYLRAKLVLEKLRELNMVAINEGMIHSYGGKRGEQVTVILQKYEPPEVKEEIVILPYLKEPENKKPEQDSNKVIPRKKSLCGRILECLPE